MFGKVQCLRTLFLVFFFNSVTPGYMQWSYYSPDLAFESNEVDANIFVNSLQERSPLTSFEFLLSPLRYGPPGIQLVRTKLLNLARSNQLDICNILGHLYNSKNITNKNDLFLKTLLLVIEQPTTPPFLKERVKDGIIYLLQQRYLGDRFNVNWGSDNFICAREINGYSPGFGNIFAYNPGFTKHPRPANTGFYPSLIPNEITPASNFIYPSRPNNEYDYYPEIKPEDPEIINGITPASNVNFVHPSKPNNGFGDYPGITPKYPGIINGITPSSNVNFVHPSSPNNEYGYSPGIKPGYPGIINGITPASNGDFVYPSTPNNGFGYYPGIKPGYPGIIHGITPASNVNFVHPSRPNNVYGYYPGIKPEYPEIINGITPASNVNFVQPSRPNNGYGYYPGIKPEYPEIINGITPALNVNLVHPSRPNNGFGYYPGMKPTYPLIINGITSSSNVNFVQPSRPNNNYGYYPGIKPGYSGIINGITPTSNGNFVSPSTPNNGFAYYPGIKPGYPGIINGITPASNGNFVYPSRPNNGFGYYPGIKPGYPGIINGITPASNVNFVHPSRPNNGFGDYPGIKPIYSGMINGITPASNGNYVYPSRPNNGFGYYPGIKPIYSGIINGITPASNGNFVYPSRPNNGFGYYPGMTPGYPGIINGITPSSNVNFVHPSRPNNGYGYYPGIKPGYPEIINGITPASNVNFVHPSRPNNGYGYYPGIKPEYPEIINGITPASNVNFVHPSRPNSGFGYYPGIKPIYSGMINGITPASNGNFVYPSRPNNGFGYYPGITPGYPGIINGITPASNVNFVHPSRPNNGYGYYPGIKPKYPEIINGITPASNFNFTHPSRPNNGYDFYPGIKPEYSGTINGITPASNVNFVHPSKPNNGYGYYPGIKPAYPGMTNGITPASNSNFVHLFRPNNGYGYYPGIKPKYPGIINGLTPALNLNFIYPSKPINGVSYFPGIINKPSPGLALNYIYSFLRIPHYISYIKSKYSRPNNPFIVLAPQDKHICKASSNFPAMNLKYPYIPITNKYPYTPTIQNYPSTPINNNPFVPLHPSKSFESSSIDTTEELISTGHLRVIQEKLPALIHVIHTPHYPKEQVMYDRLKQFLASAEVTNILNSMDLSQHNDDEIFEIIIQKGLATINIAEIKDLLQFYTNFKEARNVNFYFPVLIDLLPKPENEKEKVYFDLIVQLLNSKLVYQLIPASTLQNVSNMHEKFMIVLETLVHSGSVPADLLEAIRYYVTVLKGRQTHGNLNELLSLVPQPANSADMQNYQLLKHFFNSNEIYFLVSKLHLHTLPPDQQFWEILKYIITTNYNNLGNVALYYRNTFMIQKYGFNYFDLLNLIAPTPDVAASLEVIRQYFYTFQFQQILSNLNVLSLSDLNKFLAILEVVGTSSSDSNIIQAAQVLLNRVKFLVFREQMDSIISFIPLPQNENEQHKYQTVISFLKSEQPYVYLSHVDSSLFPNNKLFLQYILKTVVDNVADVNIKEAFEYYVDLTERLSPLEFVTKKEIRKNFKLTEIFTDAISINALTLLQKDAFKKFFKYISEIKPDAISNFQSWDIAQTRSDFMKLLFQFLLEQVETPQEIKDSILVLVPLVRIDGRAALPP